MTKLELIDHAILKRADFPKPGIQYNDVAGLTANADAFAATIDLMEAYAHTLHVDRIAGIDARGFAFASPLAIRMRLPFVMVRKPGKLAGTVFSKDYVLEYGVGTVCIQTEDFRSGDSILVVDDLFATGGTVRAACELFEEHGARIAACLAVIGLPYDGYEKALAPRKIHTLLSYERY